MKIQISLFIFFFTIGCAHTLKAQEDFQLTGVVLEKGTKSRVSEAIITNLRNNYIASSKTMGLFYIKAKVGDTLRLTKLYYHDVNVVVQSKTDLIVTLVPSVNMLDEVVITKRRVVDDLKKDFKNMPPPSGKSAALSYVFSPVSSIYNLFSTDGKNARRFSRYYDYEVKESKVDVFYNKSIIQRITGLEGKQLADFMINYRPNYQQTKNWTVYDGNKYIKDCYQKYLASLPKT